MASLPYKTALSVRFERARIISVRVSVAYFRVDAATFYEEAAWWRTW